MVRCNTLSVVRLVTTAGRLVRGLLSEFVWVKLNFECLLMLEAEITVFILVEYYAHSWCKQSLAQLVNS